MIDAALEAAAAESLAWLRARGLTAATAESCTGGLIAAALTAVAGSSDVFDRGFVTYSNQAKIDLLGVTEACLAAHGAVSGETASAMADGALLRAKVGVAVAVTGIAGPGGGSPDKPVGLVWFGRADALGVRVERRVFTGDRAAVRRAAVLTALALMCDERPQSFFGEEKANPGS